MTLGTNDNFGLNLETNGTPALSIDNTQGVSLAAGLGVTGGVNAGGDINLLEESELRFQDNTGGQFIGFKAPASVTADTTFTLPDGDGLANQVLATNGSGQLIWANDANSGTVATVFGRSGSVVAATSDYDAVQVDNTPAGDIAATNAQAAIDELDSEKVTLAGDTMTGNLNLDNESEIQLSEADGNGTNYVGFKAPALLAADIIWTLPDSVGTPNQVLRNSGTPGILEWSTPSTGTGDFFADGSVAMTGNLNIGGQSVIGGTLASADLTLESTTNATKGNVLINPNGGSLRVGAANSVNTDFTVTSNHSSGTVSTVINNSFKAGFSIRTPSGRPSQLSFLDSSAEQRWVLEKNDTAEIGSNVGSDLNLTRYDDDGNSMGSSLFINRGSGNFGIGTTVPVTKLDVEGRITSGPIDATIGNTGSLVLEELAANGTESAGFRAPDALGTDLLWTLPDSLGAANQVLRNSSTPGILEWATPTTGTGDFLANGSIAMTGSLNLGGNSVLGGTTASANLILESTSNGTKGHILLAPNGGRVGIGTTVPASNLHLNSNEPILTLTDTDTGADSRISGGSGAGSLIFGADHNNESANSEMLFFIDGTEKFRVDTDGNVGIGTTSPGTLLDVEGLITLGPIDATSGNTGSLVMEELAANGTESVGFRAPDALGADLLWTLPDSLGTANQVLRNSATPGVLEWSTPAAGITAHSGLSGLVGSDDHTQYALLTGRVGGQTLIGGANAGEDLTLQSTGNATKGDVLINPNGGNVGIGSSLPNATLSISKTFAPGPSNRNLGLSTTVTGSSASYNNTTGLSSFLSVESTGVGGVEGYAANFSSVTGNDAKSQTIFGINSDSVTHASDTGFGFRASSNASSTGGTQYGFFSNINDADLGVRWGFYQASPTANNYFAGAIGIGTDSAASKLDVEGRITSGPIDAVSGNTGSIVFKELLTNGENVAGLRSPDALAADLIWTLPETLGTANQVLRNSSTPGILEWATVTTNSGDIVNGGNTDGADMTIGTNDNFDLKFETNGVTGMRLMNDGQVGIGTADPDNALLHINGNVPGAFEGTLLNLTGNLTDPSSDFQSAIFVDTIIAPSGATTRDFTGLYLTPQTTSANLSGGSIYGILSNPKAAGSSVVDEMYAISAYISTNNTSAVENAYGVHIDGHGGSGSINNAYGLYVDSQTGGTSSNYGIYVDGSMDNYISGDLGIGGDAPDAHLEIVNNNSTTGDSFMISTNTATNGDIFLVKENGLVGIGTNLPRSKLDVNGGAIVGTPAVTNPSTTIDFATGNIQFTNNDCGAYDLHNLKDGGTYTFVVKGTGSATCSFTAFSDAGTTGLTEHLPPDHAATTASTHTIYTAMVVGSDIYFSWVPGY